MEIALGWFVFSFVAAAIASSKNRGAGRYFLISLILSPLVGIILAAAMPAVPRSEPQDKKHSPCPFCLEPIISGARKCKHCGSMLDESDPSKRACPSCERLADVNEPYCPSCGRNMTPDA